MNPNLDNWFTDCALELIGVQGRPSGDLTPVWPVLRSNKLGSVEDLASRVERLTDGQQTVRLVDSRLVAGVPTGDSLLVVVVCNIVDKRTEIRKLAEGMVPYIITPDRGAVRARAA